MPATYSRNNLLSRFKIRGALWRAASANKELVDLDPSSDGECFPIARLKKVAVLVVNDADGATPAQIEEFEVVAATDDDGTGATVVKAHALGGATPDGQGDQLVLEVDVEQIREVLATATHYGVRLHAAAASRAAVMVVEEHSQEFDGLSADVIQ
jgi:hypothetical protein